MCVLLCDLACCWCAAGHTQTHLHVHTCVAVQPGALLVRCRPGCACVCGCATRHVAGAQQARLHTHVWLCDQMYCWCAAGQVAHACVAVRPDVLLVRCRPGCTRMCGCATRRIAGALLARWLGKSPGEASLLHECVVAGCCHAHFLPPCTCVHANTHVLVHAHARTHARTCAHADKQHT